MSNNYGWCQSCGALVFNSSKCHKCDGEVKPFCVDIMLVQQAKRIKDLEDAIKNVCDLINNEGKVNKWKISNRLEKVLKGK